MASNATPVDVSGAPEIARLAQQVAEDGQIRVLRVGDADLAILSPARSAPRRAKTKGRSRTDRRTSAASGPSAGEGDPILDELERRRRQGMNVAEMTAGIFKAYAKSPPPTPREEKDAFEQAVADEVMESMRR